MLNRQNMFKAIFVIFFGYVQPFLGTANPLNNSSDYISGSSMPKSGSSAKSTEQIHLKKILEDIGSGFYQLSKDFKALQNEVSELRNEMLTAIIDVKKEVIAEVFDEIEKQNLMLRNVKVAQNQSKIETVNAVNEMKLETSTEITKLKEEILNVSSALNVTMTEISLKLEARCVNSSRTDVQEVEGSTVVSPELRNDTELTTESLVTGSNCKKLNVSGHIRSGVYKIHPNGVGTPGISVYCDMERDGGGWTIIQRRGVRQMPKSQRESFNRTWKEYENGFGSPADDHWIGLENMHSLTRHCENELKITLTRWNGTEFNAGYSNFQVAGSGDKYRLTLGNWTGGTLNYDGHTMEYNNGMKFTTFDNDNDKWDELNCAVDRKGGWWHKDCSYVNLNGEYGEDGSNGNIKDDKTGIYWYPRIGYSYMKSEMKIRSKC